MIKAELISSYSKNMKIDSAICSVFKNDCNHISQIVKLPKNRITRLKYRYLQNFDEKEAEFIPSFPYNINRFQTKKDSAKLKIEQLKKILDKENPLNNYNFYSDEIINLTERE